MTELDVSTVQPEGYINLLSRNARLLFENGQYQLAKNLAAETLRKRPYDETAIRVMGNCLKQEGDLNSAIRCFQSLVRVENKSESYFCLAEAYYDSSLWEEAFEAYAQSLELMNDEEGTLFEIFKKMGNISVRKGDYDAAEDFYNRAFAINSDSDILLVNYGTLEVQRERWESARSRFKDALRINPNCERAWIGLAVTYRALGDIEIAFADVKRAMDIDPGNLQGIRLFAEWAIELGRPQEAVERCEKFLTLKPNEFDVVPTLILALLSLGRKNQAQLELDRLRYSAPEHPDVAKLEKFFQEA